MMLSDDKMNQWIRIGTGALLIGGGMTGIIALVIATNLSIIFNLPAGVALWANLMSSLVGLLLFLWSIVTGVALVLKYQKSAFWAAIIMLLQIPYIQTSNFIFIFGTGVMLRFTIVGTEAIVGGQYQVEIPYGNVPFNIGLNIFSLVMFGYLMKVNRLEEKTAIDPQRDQSQDRSTPFGSSKVLFAITKPRNIAIFGIVAAFFVTGAVLIDHAMQTSKRAMYWVQEVFPELIRNMETATNKYGTLKHYETPVCAEGISIGKATGDWRIQTRCVVNASFDQAEVVVRMVLQEKGTSWGIREIALGTNP